MSRRAFSLLLSIATVPLAACAVDEPPPAEELTVNPAGKADGHVGTEFLLDDERPAHQFYFDCDEWLSCDVRLEARSIGSDHPRGTLGTVWITWDSDGEEEIIGHRYVMSTSTDPNVFPEVVYFQYGIFPAYSSAVEHTDNPDARFWMEFEKAPEVAEVALFTFATYE